MKTNLQVKRDIIWEQEFRAKMKPKEDRLEKLLAKNNIDVKKYHDTYQWTFNDIIDWWSTTGTAIHRKTKERFKFSFEEPEKIIRILTR